MTQKTLTTRARAAGFTIAVLALLAVALQLNVAWRAYVGLSQPGSAASQMRVQERRFAGLRAAMQDGNIARQIPAGAIVGYDSGTPNWGEWPWEREYFRTQYMLAPTPLQYTAGPRYVVLNFACDAELRAALALGRYRRLWPADADLPAQGERGDDRGVALGLALRRDP